MVRSCLCAEAPASSRPGEKTEHTTESSPSSVSRDAQRSTPQSPAFSKGSSTASKPQAASWGRRASNISVVSGECQMNVLAAICHEVIAGPCVLPLVENGEVHPGPTRHGRLVRTDADRRPVRRGDRVDERVAPLDDAADELVGEVRVRSTVPAALLERQVLVLVVIDALGRVALDLPRQKARGVRDRDTVRVFSRKQHRAAAVDLLPLERGPIPVHGEALDVLPRGLEERTRDLGTQIGAAHPHEGCLLYTSDAADE